MDSETQIAAEPVTQTGNNWDTFLQTGNIESYLLYRWTSGYYDDYGDDYDDDYGDEAGSEDMMLNGTNQDEGTYN